MWDEENDKKLRDAAENLQPAFDEKAWQKMEQLLDENLPQKKDRKRIFFLLPVILILVGFVFFAVFYHNNNNSIPGHFSQSQHAKNNSSVERPHDEKVTAPVLERNREKAFEKTGTDMRQRKTRTVLLNGKPENDVAKKEDQNRINESISPDQLQNTNSDNGRNEPDSRATFLPKSDSDFAKKDPEPASPSKAQTEESAPDNISGIKEATAETKKDEKNANQKRKKQEHFLKEFSLGFSAGPAISAVGNKQGKLALDYGIGAAYRFSKHFGIRAGVAAAKKIYSANPSQYHLGSGNYLYLEKINANCNVIDIPLSIDYYFNQGAKHLWFISTGLSSYLMKRESYDYVYKTPGGQVYNKDWTIKNQNKHFFSVLNIAAGYQHSLNHRISLVAQPYVELPLTGIGAGKVKLNSAGILFTVKSKTFMNKH